jgi:hypothetical protein
VFEEDLSMFKLELAGMMHQHAGLDKEGEVVAKSNN